VSSFSTSEREHIQCYINHIETRNRWYVKGN